MLCERTFHRPTNSSAAHMRFGAAFGAYSVAKLAVYRLWDVFAAGNPHIRVYHTQPGVVDTDMLRSCMGSGAGGAPTPEEWAKRAAPRLLAFGPRDNGKSLTIGS